MNHFYSIQLLFYHTLLIMEPRKAFSAIPLSLVLIFLLLTISMCRGKESSSEEDKAHEGPVVEKDQRKTLLATEYGEISATDVKGGHRAPPYHLQFFTLDPNSVFLPVLLHADMIFYVHTGSGELTFANEGHSRSIHLREGDLCSLPEGTVFYIQSNLEAERRKLRIYAMFTSSDDSTYDPSIGAYSRINKLVKGFDKKIMQAAFKVPEDLIEAITNKTETPAIVHAVPEKTKKKDTIWELEESFLRNFLGFQLNSKKVKAYNIFDHDPDFKNPNGWTLTVTKKQLKSLKRHNIGFLMVNLTAGSMLGPHWNPRATEINVVLQGEGMVRVVCGSSNDDDKEECQNKRFKVKQGDVFVVPRYHPMAQMSLKNEPLVFLGFSTAAKENHPQFLAGGNSMLKILDRKILATSFNVSEASIDQLLASRDDSVMFGCGSCAEEEERIMKEEKEKEKEEEEKKKKEEEEKKREDEREKEEDEAKKRQEEQRKREEEEAKRQQEERERRREEEEARRREEAEREQEEIRRARERKREEEAERARKREEEEARRQKEAERKQEEEAEREQEKAKREQEKREREREEETRREREREEEARRERERGEEEEEEAARKQKERKEEEAESEEEAARRQQEKRERKREEEEERRRQEKGAEEEREAAEREEEAARRERARRKQERREEEATEEESEEEAARRQQEKRERRREEEETRREQERRREERTEREQERTRGGGGEEEAAARRQQERRERRREEEEARREERADRERGGGRRTHRRGEQGRGREETEAEWEQEEAMRQQRERDRRRREQDGDNGKSKASSFEGRRVLKMRHV
ncbi:vicilin-like seed storage protein At2g18540 [Lotus japonicus]|uniref:vicilin-like seed storage protein At2g18540 n=1 Tax=Lotus japonicus TaxID=34305 RepID=UPI002585B972|nr:vicilin-like seed storage protein At2g18540 [Lotus japonicus]